MTASIVHDWSFLTKKYASAMVPKLRTCLSNLAFTIQATNDFELPECVLASISLKQGIDPLELPMIPKSISGDQH